MQMVRSGDNGKAQSLSQIDLFFFFSVGSPEILNAGNNSEVSVNKQAGNLAKYKDKWSLITKNHLVLEIASQCKIDFINDFPPVQTCPQCELHLIL